MNTWVHLNNGIPFACVQSDGFVEGAMLLDPSVSWEDIKFKKYENGLWVDQEVVNQSTNEEN
jgi:hypothetical protein